MMLESVLKDVRFGARVLVKDRAFTAIAVVVLGLGICGVTTQFTVVNAVALRGFSFPEPDRLASVALVDPTQDQNNNFGGGMPSGHDYEDLRAAQQSFAQLAAFLNGSTVNVTYGGSAQRYTGGYVTEDFFRIIGVSPLLGRDFTAEDNRPGAERVTIISHGIWQRDFGHNPNIIGTSIRLNGRPATVVGVMPEGFQFPINEQLWVPLYSEFPLRPREDPAAVGAGVLGRLRPGVSLDQATVEFTGLARRLAQDHPATNRQFTEARVIPLAETFVGRQVTQLLYAMLAAVAAVLLIACVNVMNMQFARAALRAREVAIRGALGASRWRLVRQMLVESLLIASAGAVLGVLGSLWAVRVLWHATQSLTFPLPYWIRFELDGRVLAATVGVTVLAALVSGLVPALLASRTSAAEVLKESGRGNTSRLVNGLTRGFVVAQIALTAALLIASTLQIRSIVNQTSLNYGYDEEAVFTARLGLFEGDHPTPEARLLFFQNTLRALRSSPLFAGAALTGRFRMTFGGFGRHEIDGQAYATDNDRPQGNFEFVSEGYFEAIGLRLLEGRDFTAEDADARQPVALVNASFARKYFGQESPVGRRVRLHVPAQPQPWRTIVGVVPDTLMQGPFNQQADQAGFYLPLLGAPPVPQFATVIVRPRPGQAASTLGAALRGEMRKLDPNLPLYFTGTPRQLHDEILGQNRIVATLFLIFGAVAVVMAAVGLYGVMSFSVNRRTQEIGVRMALGASTREILRMVLRQGGMQTAAGLLLGVILAYVLVLLGGAALQNFLYQVNPRDPLVYGLVAVLLAVVAGAACLVPARRATRVDPLVALRNE